MADRSALVGEADPMVSAVRRAGFDGLYPMWQYLQFEVVARSYSEVFLVAGACTMAGMVLALFLRSPKRAAAPSRASGSDGPGQPSATPSSASRAR
jgi:hypothetical protein